MEMPSVLPWTERGKLANALWSRVSEESGAGASTLTRITQRNRPDLDTLAALSAGSGLEVARLTRGGPLKNDLEPLAVISPCLRSDSRLNEEAATAFDHMVKAA